MKQKVGTVLIFLLGFCALLFLCRPFDWIEKDLSNLQLVILPVFLLGLAPLFARLGLPRGLTLFAAIGAMLGAGFNYDYRSPSSAVVLVSNLEQDPYEIDSRIFREKINRISRTRGSFRVERLYRALSNNDDARDLLDRDSNLGLVVWGDKKWLHLSFSERATRAPAELKTFAPWLEGLEFVDKVPATGMNFKSEEDTAQFISFLVEGLSAASGSSERELALGSAGKWRLAWHMQAHRAYPLWLLGNEYFYKAVRSGERAELDCALSAYRLATLILKRGENSELLAAILNNAALATYAQIMMPGQKSKAKLKFVLKGLRFAVSTRYDRDSLALSSKNWESAARNISTLKMINKGKRKMFQGATEKKKAKKGRKHKNDLRSGAK